jgi:hypothetical protein
MYDNINIDSTITGIMNAQINVDSTITGIMNAQIKHGQYNNRDNEC